MSISDLSNDHGNYDVRKGLPRGYCHLKKIEGVSLTYHLSKLGIDHVKALVGWSGSFKRGLRPKFDGFVIATGARNKILNYLRDIGKLPAEHKL